nr:alkyl sulfatase dimerization domain-containing protein [Jongsikchunia kroppenstedtii]
MPNAFGQKWYNRYYHGGLHHNIRAVFHKELGFWDGDPATILPLLPADHAKRHTDLIGRDKILATGRQAIDDGDYRWAIQVLHHLVFADPDDSEAKELQADAYEQLGYQQENTQYRAIFLTAALELREGIATEGSVTTASEDTILAMPIGLMFDFAGVRLNGQKATGTDLRINFSFTDVGEDWTMWVRHGVLNARPAHEDGAGLTISGPKIALAGVLLQPAQAEGIVAKYGLPTTGDLGLLQEFASVLDEFDTSFDIVTS